MSGASRAHLTMSKCTDGLQPNQVRPGDGSAQEGGQLVVEISRGGGGAPPRDLVRQVVQ
jgi:hypothetical protein